ncbi:hypothetical protein [Shinella oryzae]|uniref:hypothetical protein n=1 Tax=Shinella oryzae TaxID=2871820 RepID=UPI001FF44B36|nr:hypothetical protein [Shinella oryzae]UPA27005.1 hypothetical protein K6301_24200 [Shinella oryzae]
MASMHQFRSFTLAAALATTAPVALLAGIAQAEDLRVGTQMKLMTLDPHYAVLICTES